jgi:protoporphyrinogen IX oxidase
MLWLKSFHVVFMVTWYAVLFMMPRLMVYHMETTDPQTRAKFVDWTRRTYILGHVAFGLMFLFGIAVLLHYVSMSPMYMKQGWLHVKLLLVAVQFAYFISLGIMSKKLAVGSLQATNKFMRLYNEVPALILIAIVALVIVKPF